MRIGSLFSGYGGLDIAAAEFFGGSVAWHAEIDPAACRVLKARFPGVPNLGDVSGADWSRVEPVDVLTGGFPCQDVSHAGLRAGVRQGTRSGLWFEMARAIDALRPGIVVIENVSGLLSADAACDVEPCPWCLGDEPSGHMRALGAVLADLAEIGFDAEWASVRASDCGAAHRRERVFIVAAPHAGSGQLTRVAIGADRLPEPAERRDESVALLPTPAVNDMGAGKTVEWWDEWAARQKAADGLGGEYSDETRPQGVVSPGTDFGPYGPAIARWEQVLGRPAPSPTEPGKDGRPRLSPRFVEFMMGLPDGWVTNTGIPRNAQLKALGNGVVPQQAALALSILLPRLAS